MTTGDQAGLGDGGSFGTWVDTPAGPAFRLRPAATRPGPSNVWHQIGNDRITATAHATGNVVLFSSDCGIVRLNGTSVDRPRSLGGTWRWIGPEGTRVAGWDDPQAVATWEAGGASWASHGPGWFVRRRAWAPFGDHSLLRVDVEITAEDGLLRGGTLRESWGFAPEPIVLGGLMSRMLPAPHEYSPRDRIAWYLAFGSANLSRLATDQLRRGLAASLALSPADVEGLPPSCVTLTPQRHPPWLATGSPSLLAAIPGVVFVAELTGAAEVRTVRTGQTTNVELSLELGKRRSTTASFVVGLARTSDVSTVVAAQQPTNVADSQASWASIWDLKASTEPTVARESSWHAQQLRSAQIFDRSFGTHFVAQGSAYGYIHGIQGAPRDYAIYMTPTCFVDPAGARSMLMTMLNMQQADGSLMYAHTGSGWCTSGGIHAAPTDLPISLLWAATEYAWTTGDPEILDHLVRWRPTRRRSSRNRQPATVLERLLLAWQYLRDDIGIGPHGLVRVGSGDWNDPISAMARDRRAFHDRGESVYNSAFAAYALPRAASLIESRDAGSAAEMRAWAAQVRVAAEGAWNGRWFRRAWDGTDGVIGDDRLFLDANAWCLIAEIGPIGKRRQLAREIHERLEVPSPIGPTCLDSPIDVRGGILAPGWDTNGGVWAALSGLLAWGYALHDPELALGCLRRQLYATHARAYPNTWFGIWSGPDAFNAHYARNPGGTFVQPATPMAEFPVMNANSDAGPLLAALKVLGIESGPDGPRVRRSSAIERWSLHTTLADFSST